MKSLDDLLIFDDDVDAESAYQQLMTVGIGDGLPIVAPTRARIDAMLDSVADPDAALGIVPPVYAELTPAKIAYYSVIAGARAPELALLTAAVEACLEDDFNLLGIQTTTGTVAIAMAVHGQICQDLGLNAGSNCMGPGNHPNGRIGRALAMALRGVGGATPGELDMATTGQPGKIGLCFAHDADDPISSFEQSETGVTVLGFSGTIEVLPLGKGESITDVLTPIAEALAATKLLMGNPLKQVNNDEFVVIPPEVAALLRKRGGSAATVREQLFDLANVAFRERNRVLNIDCDQESRVLASPDDLRLLVAGGAGIKMVYLPTWMGGTRSVTRSI